jgi:hypothetical protein
MAVDLFQRVDLKGLGMGMDLTSGPAIDSDSDILVHWLESLFTGTAPTRSLPADPLVPSFTEATENVDVWFLTDHDERVQIGLEISDVTAVSPAYNSTELWMLHRNDDGRGVRRFP